ncbi:glycosyltransferase family 2 protein [Spirosoma daeguense]
MKIAGVVVLYNNPKIVQNIETYLSQIDTLFIVDNSDIFQEPLINELKRKPAVQYIQNAGNQGIAQALNQAAERAIDQGYDYLLTMDDDSGAPTNMIVEMMQFIESQPSPNQIGILSAAHARSTYHTDKPTAVFYTMTSGNLLNLKAYQAVGSFREDFFIDHVDHDYGLRLGKAGYTIIELPGIHLYQLVGEPGKKWGVNYVSRQPVRQYYMVRNGLILVKEHPVFIYKMVKLLIKELVKVAVVQTNRRERIGFIIRGIVDGISGRSGKYVP